jgi:signal transduction histidine kinase
VDGADQESRRVAQEESNRQTQLLMQEIASHQRTDAALQQAKVVAEQANLAKSRYITAISHELRTPSTASSATPRSSLPTKTSRPTASRRSASSASQAITCCR